MKEPQPTLTDTPGARTGLRRHWPIYVIAAPASVAIWAGWVGLGHMTGFGEVNLLPGIVDDGRWSTINSAITLPVGVEAYAAYALGAWLSGKTIPRRARTFAKVSAIGSLILGALGQVAYHVMNSKGLTTAPWQITTLVACLPVAVLGMAAALAHLLHAGHPADTTPTVESDTAADIRSADTTEIDGQAPDTNLDTVNDATPDPEPAPAPGITPTPQPAIRPAYTPTPRRAETRTSTRTRKPTSAQVKAQKLRAKNPDITWAQLAAKCGVNERTARRWFEDKNEDTDDAKDRDRDRVLVGAN